ncbi:MAG TPA: flavin reductase family protein [Geopsychrobacteraceae bacterium]|nr:flavin reductase family protein [Geopsychrobacteraceae bacterium]
MEKRQLGPCVTFFPQPTTLVSSLGADQSVNVMTASWAGIVSKTPPTMAISLNKGRKTYQNIITQGEFVINMVPANLAVEVDYCGIRSGYNEDKLNSCGFHLQSAELVAVPLLGESPLNLECRLVNQVELGDYVLLMGEILQVHALDAAFAADGTIDARSFDPLVYLGGIREYWDLGEKKADAYKDGKRLVARS